MLRSRTKPGDTPYGLFPQFDVENQSQSNKHSTRFWHSIVGSSSSSSSRVKRLYRFVLILLLVLVGLDRLGRWRRAREVVLSTAPYPSRASATQSQRNLTLGEQAGGDLLISLNSTWRYPLVDRTILHELDQLQDLFEVDTIPFNSTTDDHPIPRVIRLPEDSSSPSRITAEEKNARLTKVIQDGICETPAHPQPCQFLFPLRIAEQESKARIHFFQLAHLARRLNRTLVLPKVGKSKIGACFRWSFQTYYDVDCMNSALNDDAPAVVEQEDFEVWLEALGRHVNPTTRLFFVGPSLPSRSTNKGELALNKNDGIRVYDVEPYDGWKNDIPGCLSKSRWLDEVYPSFMTIAQPTHGRGSDSLSESMVAALSDEPSPTQILMLDWNLRYPLFPPSYSQQLQYSRNLVDLGKRLAPSSGYLVVHWRMETIDPNVLTDCAHALVDLLVRLLFDESIAVNVSTVWFASDYPYPIARRTKTQPRPAVEAKSGTFREFEIRHEEAVQVLRNAFEEGGELERWKVTDISEAMESGAIDKELLNDAGVLGILDKLIGIQADMFVRGSNRCARRSSFTTQIVDARMNTRRREDGLLGNIVDTFG